MAELVHGTAVAVAGRAALIRGVSGSGKSDLALRCIATSPSSLLPEPAVLVSDDQVLVEARDGVLGASPPPSIAGLIEVRGLGILRVPFAAEARLALVADLVSLKEIERLPPDGDTAQICGVWVRRIALSAFDASAHLKLLLALTKLETQ